MPLQSGGKKVIFYEPPGNLRKPTKEELHELVKHMSNAEKEVYDELDETIDPNATDLTPLEKELFEAAISDRTVLLQQLLKQNVNPNIKNKHGYTVLHHAIIYGSMRSLKILIDAGADFGKKTPDGQTAIEIAKTYNYIDIAEFLERLTAQDRIKRNADAITSVITALQDRPRRSAPALKRRQHKGLK